MKAFLDTTLLADGLLKSKADRRRVLACLARFEYSQVPQYALKELKAGALGNFVWFHNKLVQNSFADSINALHGMSLTPRRNTTSTALEAIEAALEQEKGQVLSEWATKYGGMAEPAEVLKDRMRLTLKIKIMSAWKHRRELADETVYETSCYVEADLKVTSQGLIDTNPTICGEGRCGVARLIAAQSDQLDKVIRVIEGQTDKPENQRRQKVLRKIRKNPNESLADRECRAIGDAAFAILAGSDSTILTTNERDMGPLAGALGKGVQTP